MEYVSFGDEKIPVTLVYSAKRKTIGLTVKENGEVILRIPSSLTKEEALSFAQSKAGWIEKHRQAFFAREKPQRSYADGEMIPFCGRELTIRRCAGRNVRAEVDGDLLRITAPDNIDTDTVREAVIFLYRRAALPLLREMVEEVSALAGVEPPMVRIRKQEKKWGCCTPKNGIILNVRVLLAPPLVIRYLVVHEVAHLRHRHHQASFWDEVERLMPEYREAESLLKSDGWRWVF